jgi:hypothetical protein
MPSDAGSRRRRLPAGLFICPVCGEARGKTPEGWLSVCLCQGLRCNWCGHVRRRPITDYLARDGRWVHVPWFGYMVHTCPVPVEARIGPAYTALPADDDTRSYNEALTRLTWAEVEARARAREGGRALPIEGDAEGSDPPHGPTP